MSYLVFSRSMKRETSMIEKIKDNEIEMLKKIISDSRMKGEKR